ncbi:MAG: SixA phosphatase family protein [Iamia sp.]
MTLYLVRHAHAGRRSEWADADAERPLSEKGRHQSEALTRHLADATIDRVLSSPAVRCRQTVEGMARERNLEIEGHPALLEGATDRSTTTLLSELATEGRHVVLSSHGDVIPGALQALRSDGLEVDDRHGLPKGTLYRLEVDDEGHMTTATFVDPRP